MASSVASLTVAYNAANQLSRQLEALYSQTRRLQEIIVVDNASTDGTAQFLAERYPQVTVLRMSENLGMAGAWSRGLSYAALKKGHDWIWTFDDDSVPKSDTLEIMLRGKGSLNGAEQEVGMLAPMPVHLETGTCYPPLLWRDGFVKPSAHSFEQRIWFADLVITSGCMVRREVVEQVGLPRADFFMDFFDFEYCLRARSRGFKIAVINEARMGHEIGNSREVRLPGFVRLWTSQPPWREYYISRNLAYLAWWLYPSFRTKKFTLRHLAIHSCGVFLFSSRKWECLTKIVRGFMDGIRGKLGIRFLPDATLK